MLANNENLFIKEPEDEIFFSKRVVRLIEIETFLSKELVYLSSQLH